jgi:hypothetical protein
VTQHVWVNVAKTGFLPRNGDEIVYRVPRERGASLGKKR